MSRIFKTEAIVLRQRHRLKKDTIVTLFTQRYGRLKVFAFGIKKITSRRLSHLQTGNLVTALIYKKDGHFYLQETQLLSGFSQIKNNQQKISYLYFFLFVLDRLLPEGQKEGLIYQWAKKFLITLSKEPNFNNLILNQYLNKTLMLLGYLKEEKSFDEACLLIEELIHEKIPYFK